MNSIITGRATILFFTVIATWAITGCATGSGGAIMDSEWALDRTPLDRSAGELESSTAGHLAEAKAKHAEIMGVADPRTIENTLVPYNALMMHVDAALSECSLLARVHPDESVRKTSEQGVRDVTKYATELSLDRKLYDALASLDIHDADRATRFLMKKVLRDFRRAGVDKTEAQRDRIRELNEEIVKIGQTFQRNIAENVREITVDSPADLAGLPQDWIDKHTSGDDGKIHITTEYPDYKPFMKYARNAAAREAIYREFKNRGFPKNIDVLNSLLLRRYELAKVLGYDNYADYITGDKMVGSAASAATFLERIAKSGKTAAAREYKVLLERKRKDTPAATKVQEWERGYYQNLVKAEQYAFDAQAVRPYFNYGDVRAGIFELTGKLFDIRYQPVSGLNLWHESVTAWDVYDGEERLGRFFLDMHPRKNKYGHAAQFDYRNGVKGLRLPQAVLVCNFPNPADSPDGVALMEHDQVVTFFHEFGHLLHTIFAGHQRWLGISGITTEWDFVEAPSQMLEEWCYNTEALQVFAKHYQTGDPIPAKLVKNLRRASEFGKGLQNAHQVFYSTVSLNFYNRDPKELDTTRKLAELQAAYSPFPYVDGTHFQCSFGHLDGYSAIYYTYRWSLVIAKAMLDRFERDGLLNKRTARRYREKILEPGGSKPASELIKDFLGHPYTFEPFERWLNRT